MKTKYKALANFAIIKLNIKLQKKMVKKKINFVEWLKYKKCGCKY